MILGEPGSERYRSRLGLLMLVIGIVLLLWAWSSWLYRASVPTKVDGHAEILVEPTAQRMLALRSSPLFLMVFFVLILAFFVGSYVVVRMIRRYRDTVLRNRAAPTDAQDVWRMHRPPRDADEVDA